MLLNTEFGVALFWSFREDWAEVNLPWPSPALLEDSAKLPGFPPVIILDPLGMEGIGTLAFTVILNLSVCHLLLLF